MKEENSEGTEGRGARALQHESSRVKLTAYNRGAEPNGNTATANIFALGANNAVFKHTQKKTAD